MNIIHEPSGIVVSSIQPYNMKNDQVKKMMSEESQHLQKLQTIVKDTIAAEELIIQNLLHPPEEQLSAGQKISDKVARFGGSWSFIILFMIFWGFGSFLMCWH